MNKNTRLICINNVQSRVLLHISQIFTIFTTKKKLRVLISILVLTENNFKLEITMFEIIMYLFCAIQEIIDFVTKTDFYLY